MAPGIALDVWVTKAQEGLKGERLFRSLLLLHHPHAQSSVWAAEAGNTIRGQHVGVETTDCIVQTRTDHLVATFGVEGLLIVHTPTATLVARRDDEAGVRRLVAEIQRLGLGWE